MRLSIMILPGLALAACETVNPTPPLSNPTPEAGQLVLGSGYRDPADPCRRAGETDATAEFLDHTRDLVACPEGGENLGVFVTETGAEEVARVGGYILYSVPRT